MTHRLFVAGERVPALTARDFLWDELGRRSSFWTSIDPDGHAIGVTMVGARELLRLGIGVYLVDRTVPRARFGWSRDLDLELPVADVGAWQDRAPAVEALLDFLSGDHWALSFRRFRGSPITRAAANRRSDHDLVSLFSGGMDSFAGAARAIREGAHPHLVGQWNWTAVRGSQGGALDALEHLTGARPEFAAVHAGRRAQQIAGGAFGTEASSRSRSLLFLAIGAAVATGTRAQEVWVPENGWVSLNVPLDGSRRSSLTTRTTHPGLLDELTGLAGDLGLGIRFRNAWEGRTKGDLVRWVANEWGDEAAADAFAATDSCAKSGMQFYRLRPDTHCGVCYACLVRRGAFLAAGVPDRTPYADSLLTGADRDRFMRNRRHDLAAIGAAGRDGHFAIEDILALDLPPRIRPDDALALANRGLDEVRLVTIP
jgi:hypothetical protein